MSQDDVVVLLNAEAAGDATFRSLLDSHLTLIELDGPEAAEHRAKEAADTGCRAVIVCGGDGTLNDAINGVLHAANPCPIGVIPFGTANDFATAVGIAALSQAEQLRLILDHEPTAIDVGRMNDRYFVNAASVGFGAEVTADTPDVLKNLLGGAAYSLTGAIKVVTHLEKRVRVTGPFEWEGDLLFLNVANSQLAGGGYKVAPDARIDDGLLDVTLIPDVEVTELPALLEALTESLLSDQPTTLPNTQKARTASLQMSSATEVSVNLDGQPIQASNLEFSVVTGRLRFFLPSHCSIMKAATK